MLVKQKEKITRDCLRVDCVPFIELQDERNKQCI